MKNPTIGQIIDAFETVAAAAQQIAPNQLAMLMTSKLYGCQTEEFLKVLELAGDRAMTLLQEQRQEECWNNTPEPDIFFKR